MKWNSELKDMLAYVSACTLLLFGMFLLCWGFFTPPEGEIHSSLQLIFGQCLVYSGATFGIALHFDNKSKIMEARIDQKIKNLEHK